MTELHPTQTSQRRAEVLPWPEEFGQYELVSRIGTGGMAEVWLARQQCMAGVRRELVIKRILPHLASDPSFVRMLRNEAKLSARFSHPNIVQIFELGEVGGTHYIAMEYVRGADLAALLQRAAAAKRPLRTALALRIIAECCNALSYAHGLAGASVVHRDISPSNILISREGAVKLVDFGIAKAADSVSVTQPGMVMGKFAYMSPEQAAGGELDHRSDLFSLGLVLYELLTGVRPFKRDSDIATLRAATECRIRPPSRVADVDPDLDAVVMKALRRDRDLRYANAREFQLAIERLLMDKQWFASTVHLSEQMNRLFPVTTAEVITDPGSGPESQAPSRDTTPGRRLGDDDDWNPTDPMAAPRFPEPVLRSPPARRASTLAPQKVNVPRAPTPRPAPMAARTSTPRPVASAARPSPARRRRRHLSLIAGGSAALWLGVVLLLATRTSASPLSAEAPLPVVSVESATAPDTAPWVDRESGQTGMLTVVTSPATDVYLGDQRLGTTPLNAVRVPAGTHQLRLENDGARVHHVVRVDVEAGQAAHVRVAW
ncbi:MAG TPA: serine/threonine-protein kinase [Myxococcaceae bacterium]|nr:serine/threonine-protein kinase [Myxococcaceae bacterium]